MISRRNFIASAAVLGAGHWLPALGARSGGPRDVPAWSLYAFDNGLDGPDVPTIAAKVALVKRLGFAGMTDHFSLDRLEKVLEEIDRHGLELVSLYHVPYIEDEPEPRLAQAIRLLKGRRTRIELGFLSRRFKPSDPAGDERGLHWLRHLAGLCGDTGPVISIYPHKWFWTERVEDGVRLAKKAGTPLVGTNFNLIHWQISPPSRPVAELFQEALPHLSLVSICGMQRNQTAPEVLPLSEGDFDVSDVLQKLKRAGYAGPIGLQCYGIKGNSAAHLSASMGKWRAIRPRAA